MKRTKAPGMVRTKKSKSTDNPMQRTKAPAMKRTKKGEGEPSPPTTLQRTKAPGMVRTKKKQDTKPTKPKKKREPMKRKPGQPPHLLYPGHMPSPPDTCNKRRAFQDEHGTEYIDNTICAECKFRCQRREEYYKEWMQYKQERKEGKHK